MTLTPVEIERLNNKARDIRVSIIEMLVEAKSGHTAGPLDMADVFATLYFKALRHNPENPEWAYRDRVILSNGHICPVLYATMAHSGYFPMEELMTLRKLGSRLQGHPHREFLPGIETSSGPLGCGLGQAIGMAIVDRNTNPINYVFKERTRAQLESEKNKTSDGNIINSSKNVEGLKMQDATSLAAANLNFKNKTISGGLHVLHLS